MAVFSGRDGNGSFSSEIVNVRNWTVTVTSTSAQGNHSDDTSHWADSHAGVRSWTGACDVYLDDTTEAPRDFSGDVASLHLVDGSNNTYVGTAVVSEVSYNCDIEGGELVSASLSFIGDGGLAITRV